MYFTKRCYLLGFLAAEDEVSNEGFMLAEMSLTLLRTCYDEEEIFDLDLNINIKICFKIDY